MAATLHGSVSNTVSGSSSISTGSMPAGSTGKVAFAWLMCPDADTLSTPSGWTLVESESDGSMQFALYWRVLASTSSVTFNGSAANKKCIVVYVVDGLDTTTPINTGETPARALYSSTSSTRAIPSGTCAGDRGALTFVGSRGSSAPSSWNSPSPWTDGADAYNTSSGASTAAGAFRTYTAGSVGGGDWTANSSESRGVVKLLILNPAATDATFATTVGEATADGGSTSFTADAVFTADGGTATADGGATAFTADGTFTTAAGDATADGGSATFTGSAVFDTSAADATAAGGTGTFTADAVFTAQTGTATAEGGSASFSGGATGTFTTLTGDATAAGGQGTFTADAAMVATTGEAVADGGIGVFTAAAWFTTLAGEAVAAGGGASFVDESIPALVVPKDRTLVASGPALTLTGSAPARTLVAAGRSFTLEGSA